MTDNTPLIVFPDTHGHLREVEVVLDYCRKNGLFPGHLLLFLGDYLDRGPDVRGLMDLLVELQKEGHIFLAGNHEFVLRSAFNIRHPQWEYWLRRWAVGHEDRTLESYGVKRPTQDVFDNLNSWKEAIASLWKAMPDSHKRFLFGLPLFHETADHIFVHAGLTTQPWVEQKEYLSATDFGTRGPEQIFSAKLAGTIEHGANKLVVSGHRAFKIPVRRANRLLLHCGVESRGPLVAWVSDTDRLIARSIRTI